MAEPMDSEEGLHGGSHNEDNNGQTIGMHMSDPGTTKLDTMELPEASKAQLMEQQEKVQAFEMRRKMRSIAVPVLDADVRKLLRRMKEPITLFGEREMERRSRAQALLAAMTEQQLTALSEEIAMEWEEVVVEERPKEVFYTEGTEDLKLARLEIASFSLQRASKRLAKEKQLRAALPDEQNKDSLDSASTSRLEAKLESFTNITSEVADERPISTCQFSPDGSLLMSGSWNGNIKFWTMPNCTQKLSFKAHEDRVTGAAWHPHVDTKSENSQPACLTGSADCTARIWSQTGKLLQILQGHADRLARVACHPMGRHCGTASFDLTWRFWDMETGQCLVEQEGHSRAVYCVAFQRDGALAVSGGLDGYGRLWDLRTGRSIMVLEGHVASVLSADFNDCGYQVATGSADNTARVFDIRKKGTFVILPGHTSLISQVKFEPEKGRYLLTSGYDNTSKLWCGKKYKLVKTLAGHEGKVMGSDIAPATDTEIFIASAGYDRTLKLWQPDDLILHEAMEV